MGNISHIERERRELQDGIDANERTIESIKSEISKLLDTCGTLRHGIKLIRQINNNKKDTLEKL